MAIPEMEEEEGEYKNVTVKTQNNNQINNNTYINNTLKNKINITSKTSLTGFLMTTNKLGKK